MATTFNFDIAHNFQLSPSASDFFDTFIKKINNDPKLLGAIRFYIGNVNDASKEKDNVSNMLSCDVGSNDMPSKEEKSLQKVKDLTDKIKNYEKFHNKEIEKRNDAIRQLDNQRKELEQTIEELNDRIENLKKELSNLSNNEFSSSNRNESDNIQVSRFSSTELIHQSAKSSNVAEVSAYSGSTHSSSPVSSSAVSSIDSSVMTQYNDLASHYVTNRQAIVKRREFFKKFSYYTCSNADELLESSFATPVFSEVESHSFANFLGLRSGQNYVFLPVIKGTYESSWNIVTKALYDIKGFKKDSYTNLKVEKPAILSSSWQIISKGSITLID